MTSVNHLIDTFVPDHYDLSIHLNREARTFRGVVTMTGTTLAGATDIRVHAKDLTIHSVVVDGKAAEFKTGEFDELIITHPDIHEGHHVVVIDYSGEITDTMNGIYPSYYDVDGQKKELMATQFESHYARQAFPCIDEPEAKATFDVTLTTEPKIIVLGNMPIASQSVQNGKLVTQFETTPRMSTYLVAWVAGDLHAKTATTKDGVEVSIWATPAQAPESLDFALSIATRTIEFFNDYFGVPYPLPKSDHVALPDFSAGAMENWGLITYREIALLVDPKQTTLSVKQYAATVIAHELSHQWFGNLVTMKWWNDLWLNESFADMMEYIAIDALEPEWNVWLDHAASEVVSALRRDSLDGVQAIQSDVNHPDEISTMFDPSIVYAKGGRLLRMLQAYIGTNALRAGLKTYFETHQYTNTTADDLWVCLANASGKDVSGFMHAWMTQPGYPVVHVSKEGDTVSLAQSQFFIGEHTDIQRLWPIPLHGASSEIPELLDTPSLTFTYTNPQPLRLNTGGTAHFITHYNDELLQSLLENLASLPTIDRLQLLHEQTLLAQAGIISSAQLISLLDAYKEETEESVWSIMSLAINELKKFVETDDQAEKNLRHFVQTLVQSQYDRLGWNMHDGESENDTKLRSTIIALSLYGEIPDAITTANTLYAERVTSPLDPELRTGIMANAVRQTDGQTVVDELLAEYAKTPHSELRDDIAAALTSTRSETTVIRLASLLKDPTSIRPQDFSHWFVWLLRNRYGRAYMWQWCQDQWDWIEKTFKDDAHYEMYPRYVAGALVTHEQLDAYKAFFTPKQTEVALARNITIGITELTAKVAHIERDQPAVQAALQKAIH